MRWRTAIGGPIIVVGLIAYVAAAATVATEVLPDHWLAELVFYPLAGLLWIWPALAVIGWTKRDREP